MGSSPPPAERPPHAVMVPFPAQGHVTPMLNLAKLLHARGFHVTFVNTELTHRRLLRSRGPAALDGAPRFRFTTIPDGLPPLPDDKPQQDVDAICYSTMTTCLQPFKDLIARLNGQAEASSGDGGAPPPVTCVVADGTMTFGLRAARELGLPSAALWTASTCGFLGYYHYKHLLDRGLYPPKGVQAELSSNGYLDTTVDSISGMPGDLRLRDLPSYVRTAEPFDVTMFDYFVHETAGMSQATAVLVNTFDELEAPALDAMAKLLPPLYTVGPLHLTARNNMPEESPVLGLGSSLWKEQEEPLRWLAGRPPRSVVYVNFGSTTTMSRTHLTEFAWGLAGTGYPFLWNVRPDLVHGDGDGAALPPEFAAATEGRSMLSTWCPQEKVLEHAAVGIFLTHSGWNSTLESVAAGVPMVCWPFFAEQYTNCRFKRTEWGVGMEIAGDVRRSEVEALIREAMEGRKGLEMRRRAAALRESAVESARPGGRSVRNVEKVIRDVLVA